MKKHFLICFIWLLILGCSKDQTTSEIVEESEEVDEDVNLAPNDFSVSINNVTHDSVLLAWEEANDPENDAVSYQVYLEEELITEDLQELKFQLSDLDERTSYTGKVVAKDSNDNETKQTFSFQTEKYFLKFVKAFNYADSEYAQGGAPYSMIRTNDNNYVIAGSSNFNGNGSQFFVLKIDYEGNKIWQKFYPYQLYDSWQFKITESSNGLILAGHHHLLSLDHDGNMIWKKEIEAYDRQGGGGEIKSVAQDSQDNIFAVGTRGSSDTEVVQEAVLTKFDNSGNLIWEKSFSPSIRSSFADILITELNELVILGSTETDGITYDEYVYGSPRQQIDFWVVKLTLEGEEIWNKTYGDGRYDFAQKIIEKSNGNFVFAGFGWGAYDISAGRIFEIDQNGTELLNITTDLSSTFSVAETSDNGLVATGSVDLGDFDALGIFKFDRNGEEQWRQQFQQAFTYLRGSSILAEEDGGFRIAGSSAKNYYDIHERAKILVYKTDPEGNYE